MSDAGALTLVLTLAALLVPLDRVRSAYGLERARAHDRALARGLAVAVVAVVVVDLVAGLVAALGLVGWWREGERRLAVASVAVAAVWLVAPRVDPWPLLIAWPLLALAEGGLALWHWGGLRGWWQPIFRGVMGLAGRLGIPPQHTAVGLAHAHLTPEGVAWLLPKLRPLAGLHGQHTLFAASLALVVPLGWAWHWTVGLVLVAGVVGISSWGAILAAAAGLLVVAPWTAWPVGAALAAGLALLAPRLLRERETWLNVLPRGDSLDSVRVRWANWRALAAFTRDWTWREWLVGRGWTGPNLDMMRAQALKRTTFCMGTAHNDVVELCYAHGLLGVSVLAALAWRVGPGLAWGDPWSACVVAGLVVGLASPALHYPGVGLPWWIACALVAQGGRG